MVVLADSLWLLVLSAMLLSASTNTTQGAWQALIPDRVPEAQHGTAAGVKTLLEMIGVVGAVAVAGITLSRGNLWGGPVAALVLFYAILLITLSTLWGTKGSGNLQARRAKVNEPQEQNDDVGGATARSFDAPLLRLRSFLQSIIHRMPPSFPWWMLNRFLFWSAAISVRTFMLNYMEDVLAIPPAEAQALSSRIFLVLGAGVFLLALPAGAIADRIGRRPLLIGAGLSAAGGAAILIFSRDITVLFVAGGLIAVGAGIFASASWALATDLVPTDEGAQYLGLANVATVLGSIGGRLGGPLIDGVNQLAGSIALGYMVVFGIATLFFVGSSLAVLKIAEGRPWRA
jgi:MFS family permease